MCDPCGYPSLDLQTRAAFNTASLNMADDAWRGTSMHGQEAQLYLSRMYTFKQVMSLQDAVHFAIAHPRKDCPSLFTASFGTQQLKCWNLGVYYQKSLRNLFDLVELMYISMILLCFSLKNASISQLPYMCRRWFLTM